jgi:hypothetical protein
MREVMQCRSGGPSFGTLVQRLHRTAEFILGPREARPKGAAVRAGHEASLIAINP